MPDIVLTVNEKHTDSFLFGTFMQAVEDKL